VRHSRHAVPRRPGERRARSDAPGPELADQCARLNEAFHHWIIHRTPFVTVKAAMTLDGKIATAGGESKWITGEQTRAYAMKLRQGADAVLVGVNTVLADNPSLTFRPIQSPARTNRGQKFKVQCPKQLRRIILDSMARTPLTAKVVSDEFAARTTIVVSHRAPRTRVAALAERAHVLVAPAAKPSALDPSVRRSGAKTARPSSRIDLRWLLKRLGSDDVISLLVEGGGEVNASFLLAGLAHRITFGYAPKILGGRDSLRAVAGEGVKRLADALRLRDIAWKRLGPDLLLTARIASAKD